jgi:hypothetical protein
MLFYIFTLIFNINEAIVGNNDSTAGAGVPVKDDDLLHETLLEIYGVLTSTEFWMLAACFSPAILYWVIWKIINHIP